MRLSKRCEYGIKAAIRLSLQSGKGYLQSREIASSERLPAKFLESILLALRSASLLESKVGAGGGYRLSRPPAQIRVSVLIRALESPPEPEDSGETDTPGGAALAALNARLDEAVESAVGDLTLAEVCALTETSASISR